MSKNDDVQLFHKHLDECEQCREQPMNLCLVGAIILKIEVDCTVGNLPTGNLERR